MYRFLTKNGQYLAVGLGLLVTVIYLISVYTGFSGSETYTISSDLLNGGPEGGYKEVNFFNSGLWLTILLLIIAVLTWVLFSVFQVITNPKGALKFLMGFGLILLIFLLFYFVLTTDVTGKLAELITREEISTGVMRFINGGIYTAILLALLALLAMVVTEVINIFK